MSAVEKINGGTNIIYDSKRILFTANTGWRVMCI